MDRLFFVLLILAVGHSLSGSEDPQSSPLQARSPEPIPLESARPCYVATESCASMFPDPPRICLVGEPCEFEGRFFKVTAVPTMRDWGRVPQLGVVGSNKVDQTSNQVAAPNKSVESDT